MELKITLVLEERDENNALVNTYCVGDIITLISNKDEIKGKINSIKYYAIELDLSERFSSNFITLNTKDINYITKQ